MCVQVFSVAPPVHRMIGLGYSEFNLAFAHFALWYFFSSLFRFESELEGLIVDVFAHCALLRLVAVGILAECVLPSVASSR